MDSFLRDFILEREVSSAWVVLCYCVEVRSPCFAFGSLVQVKSFRPHPALEPPGLFHPLLTFSQWVYIRVRAPSTRVCLCNLTPKYKGHGDPRECSVNPLPPMEFLTAAAVVAAAAVAASCELHVPASLPLLMYFACVWSGPHGRAPLMELVRALTDRSPAGGHQYCSA